MRRQLALIGIAAALTFSLCGTAAAVPGNGANGLLIFNDCDSGVGEITLVNQGSLNGLFATAHVVGTNRPVPLISLEYDLYIGGELIESGGYAHRHTRSRAGRSSPATARLQPEI